MLIHFSHIRLCVALWTIASQAPLSMGFSRQEYWSGLPWYPPGDLPVTLFEVKIQEHLSSKSKTPLLTLFLAQHTFDEMAVFSTNQDKQ